MTNDLCSFTSSNGCDFEAGFISFEGYYCEKEEALSKGKQQCPSDRADGNSFCSELAFYQGNIDDRRVYFSEYDPPPLPPPLPSPVSNYGGFGNLLVNNAFLSAEPIVATSEIENAQLADTSAPQSSFSFASLMLLNCYTSGFNKLKEEKSSNGKGDETKVGARKLSTEEIMRIAGENYIQFCTQRIDDVYMLTHPYSSTFTGFSLEQAQDVELAHFLLAAAEKVGYQQFERASRLLSRCEWLASDRGNGVQRVVYYFSQALRERIDRETGRFSLNKAEEKEKHYVAGQGSSNLVFLACHQALPFTQVMLFAGIQAILENVATETKIHLIDFQIRSGVQWTVLMQALAERVVYRVECLKISAIATADRQKVEETGKRLTSVAASLNLPFSFKVVLVQDMKDLRAENFDVQPREAVGVYSSMILRTMISKPPCLENLMWVMRRFGPIIMVVTEVEANHNSPSFFNRFIEALFFYSAFFDCFQDCTEGDNRHRMIVERTYFGEGIRNIVAAEGRERFNRNVNMSAWRMFFARVGMVEIELSESSLYQAHLVLKQFPCGSSCNLETDGKSLIVGWKGTPIHSLSTWRFR